MPGELKSTGQLGEDLAVRFLEASGAMLVERNVRPGTGCGVRGELDVLCLDGQTLCVVEVKTLRRRGSGMSPGMNVTAAKQRQIVMLTQLWLYIPRLRREPKTQFRGRRSAAEQRARAAQKHVEKERVKACVANMQGDWQEWMSQRLISSTRKVL